MTTTYDNRSDAKLHTRPGHLQAGIAAQCRCHFDPVCRDEHHLVGMHLAFRATGGLLSLNEVRTLFQRYRGPDSAVLDGWIRKRTAIAFVWREETWLPMFQFSRKGLSVHQSLEPVLQQLSAIYDGWETANWFALPNTWLRERAPVAMLAHDLSAVWYAARVDRFIALGEAKWEKQPLMG